MHTYSRTYREQETVLPVIRACTTLNDFAVAPVSFERVALDAVFETDTLKGLRNQIIDRHAVDTSSGKPRVSHKVGRRLGVTDKGSDETILASLALHAVDSQCSVADNVGNRKGRERHFGLRVTVGSSAQVAHAADGNIVRHNGGVSPRVVSDNGRVTALGHYFKRINRLEAIARGELTDSSLCIGSLVENVCLGRNRDNLRRMLALDLG